ncbi:histone-lysine N-methyltransferase [Powellomyces hirtus]|uniref:[histone H3]-lysine(36) N-trimethyltransferase n=1 Tax=Powellomyces hirtus TaxID=109895 RepID=A0A507EEL2_9FUNG|nr:histone-lysine N-methyltransferase [Powellomyces hirtus]
MLDAERYPLTAGPSRDDEKRYKSEKQRNGSRTGHGSIANGHSHASLESLELLQTQTWEKPVCASPEVLEKVMKVYTHIMQNEYMGSANGRTKTEEYMVCECQYDPGRAMNTQACGDDANCINRELFIECIADSCPSGQYCQNRKFQNRQYAPIEIFETEKKGFGLRATAPIRAGSFVIEYCGEVITAPMFKKRTQEYDKDGVKHFYFMSLKSKEFIDAAKKGNMSRFMNHSCAPNCALHKWIVGDSWRIGMFALKDLDLGEELTFDYKFQRYGAKAQECFCGSANCSGYIGGEQTELTIGLGDELESYIDDDVDAGKKTARRIIRRSGHDSDYEAEVHEKHEFGVVRDIDDIRKLVRGILRHVTDPRRVTNLLTDIEQLDLYFLRRVIWVHGLTVLKWCLDRYICKNDGICLQILRVLDLLPMTSRNERIEESVQKLADMPDVEISSLAKTLLEKWSILEKAYKIPKRSSVIPLVINSGNSGSQISPVTTGAPKRPLDDQDYYRAAGTSPTKRYRIETRDDRRDSSESAANRSEAYRASSVYTKQVEDPSQPRPDYDSRPAWSRSRPEQYESYRRDSREHRSYSPRDRIPPAASRDWDTSGHSSRKPTAARLLPEGWNEARCPEGQPYYYNKSTGEVQWEFPGTTPNARREPEHRSSPDRATSASHLESDSPSQQPHMSIDSVTDDPPAGSEAVSTPSHAPLEYPKRRKRELGDHVAKVLSNYEIPQDIFKDRAKQISRALMEKEQKKGAHIRDTLSDRSKVSITEYVKDWCHRHSFKRKEKRGRHGKRE